MSVRTYYVTEGIPRCKNRREHWDECACAGFEAPEVWTLKPDWPMSNRFVSVRASSEAEAARIATTVGGKPMYSGGLPRRIGHQGSRWDMLADISDHDLIA